MGIETIGLLAGGTLLGGLLGGGGNQISGSPPSATNQPTMTPEQQAALRDLLSNLTGRTNAFSPFTGQLSAGPTQGQASSLAAMEQQALRMATAGAGADATLTRLQGENGTDVSNMFEQSVANPAIKQFNEKILPEITKRYAGASAFSSDRRDTERRAAGDLSDSLASARSKMTFDATEAAKNRQLQAATAQGGLDMSRETAIAGLLDNLFRNNTLLQTQQQGGLDRIYQEFTRMQGGGEQNIKDILTALGLNTTNTVVNPGQQGLLQGMGPGIGSLLTMLALGGMK